MQLKIELDVAAQGEGRGRQGAPQGDRARRLDELEEREREMTEQWESEKQAIAGISQT